MARKVTSLDKLEKVSRGGVRDRVYGQIQDMLLCGEIPPGESMPIRVLAERLGTSPMPVREALRQLLSEQGIEMLPNRTIRVPMMTLPKFLEIRNLRILLEGNLAALAAGRVTKADIKNAQSQNLQWRKHTLGPRIDIPKSMLFNKQLHFTVYRAADQPITFTIVRSLWLQIAPFFGMIMRDMHEGRKQGQSISRTGDQHDALVAALEKGDGERAREAIVDDIMTATEVYINRHWPDFESAGSQS
ncbi:MAG: GntR family transcriptional regulator [Microvirga sp.]|nr:GntR family transcriptional regulator [Microvirga sp.]